MKKFILLLVLGLSGMSAHANIDEYSSGDETHILGERLWACGMTFKGTSKGLKFIVGHFTTVAYGTLRCKGIKGTSFVQKVRVSIGHHWIGPTVGIGYFKMLGTSSELSLFNSSPHVILGNYLVAQGEAAIIGGVGMFRAVKVGHPQLAANFSTQLLGGLGVEVGIDKLTISAID